MKGIIMAGGEGTRLRPLTCDCPKPMIRLMNRPVMEYALQLLRKHGVADVVATLGYLPDAITDYFGDGSRFGVRLEYRVERSPLGTAGGVRQAADLLDETFVVLSGDGVTDLDITRAAAYHREHNAMATLVLKHADNPLDYGVVDVDASGRIRRFHEKPDWSDVIGDTVNTGIYILEPEVLSRVPEGRPCDFGHELFPRLVAEGLPVFGYVTEDYWCDVGDVRAYLGAHIDAMEGRIRLDGLMPMPGRAVQLPGASVDRAAVLEGPCLIDAGARVCAGAYVGPYSVIGAGCVVGEGASIKRGILWPGATAAPGAQARGCVLGTDARLGEGAQAYEESVLGSRAEVGPRGVVLPGVKLWPGQQAAEGERLDANRVWGSRRLAGFSAGTLPAATPAEAARAAQACAAALKPREVVLGRSGQRRSEALWHAAAAGIMAQGARVIDAGACGLPVLRHAQRSLRADAAMFIEGSALLPLNALGARLSGQDRRTVAALNARQDYVVPAHAGARPVIGADAAAAAYIADTASLFAAAPRQAPPLALGCERPALRGIAEEALLRAGLSVRVVREPSDMRLAPGELGLVLGSDGEQCALADESGMLTDGQRQLLIAWTALAHGEGRLILPVSATRAIEELAAREGAAAEYIAGDSAMWMNALAERSPFQFDLHFDGLRMAVAAVSLLAERRMTLGEWRAAMPDVHRRSRSVAVPPRHNGRVLHAMAQAHPDARLGGGVRFERDGGWAWVGADERRSRLRVVTEGASAEFARELCDFCEGELKRLSAGFEGK